MQQKVTITDAGNVGIGTTTPSALMDVHGGISMPYNSPFTTDNEYSVNNTIFNTVFNNSQDQLQFSTPGADARDSAVKMTLQSDGSVGIGTSTPWAMLAVNPIVGVINKFVVGSSTATAFVINNAGQVGIGTTTPTNALEVAGTSYFTNTINLISATNAQINQNRNAVTNTAQNIFRTAEVDQWSMGLRNDSTTSATSNDFHIRDAVDSIDGINLKQGTSVLLGVGTSTETANFQATNSAANATTSIQFGKANQNKGTCNTYYDTAGTPVYMYFAAGSSSPTYQNGGTAPSGCKN